MPESSIRQVIEIAGLRLALELPTASMTTRVLERYEGFLADPQQSDPDLELSFEIDAKAPCFHPVWVENPAVRSRGDLMKAVIEGEGFEGAVDWNQGRGRARIPDSLSHVDLFVRIALGGRLLREGDTLLHAAAVRRDGWGLVFAGPSGAGKSTIADLCRQAGLDVLADEMVVLRHRGAGVRVYGTPFWSGIAGGVPAGAIFLIEQAPAAEAASLPPDRALAEILAAGGAPLDLPAVQQAFFETVGGLLRRVPAYRLRFAKHPGFWAAIDRLPEFAFFRPRTPRLKAEPPSDSPIQPRTPFRLPSANSEE